MDTHQENKESAGRRIGHYSGRRPIVSDDVRLLHGDCLDVLPTLEAGSVDAIITDPIYPEVDRDYGRISEADWHDLMRGVVRESRRILKPHGSAVFILQPNSERVGRMRLWLWEFMAWAGREWGLVQDVWWWNTAAMPTVHCNRDRGLMRPSVKACVWLGPEDCYRNQDEILIEPTDAVANDRRSTTDLQSFPSGQKVRRARINGASRDRGGVTPFNVLPMANTNSANSAGSEGHGAGTPHDLADWWVRYLTRPGDVVLDMFAGSGTIPLAAYARDRKAIAIEKDARYIPVIERRIRSAITPLFA
jgi:DNA modification methylase